MVYMELLEYLKTRLQMFNKDFTPKQKAFLNEKFSRLEAILIKSSIDSHIQLDKSKISNTIIGQLKPIGESLLKSSLNEEDK